MHIKIALNTRIDPELKKKLAEAALQDSRTVSSLVEIIIREYLKQKGE